MKKIKICGVKIDNITLSEAVNIALRPGTEPCFTVTPNAVMLDTCRRDRRYAALLNQATLSLPDGAGVLYVAKKMGTPLQERIPGISFGEAILREAARKGLRVFLLGGKSGIAKRAEKNLCADYPGLNICGSHWGYFSKTGRENQRVLSQIYAAKTDILFVCFGFPFQEAWIYRNLEALSSVRLIAGLGGSLDVWAGKTKRAPDFFIRHGLEWAWRMAKEPKRLKNLPALIRFVTYRHKKRQRNP